MMKRKFYIDTVNKTINLSFDFDKDIIADIKACDFNARWNPELEEWIIPLNEYSKGRAIALITGYRFKRIEKEQRQDVKVDYKRTDTNTAYLKGLCDAKGFTYTPRDYQLEALGYAMEKGSIINGDDCGLGKCESVDNMLFTPQGRKRIGDIVVGDYVIGSNGKKTRVSKVHPQPKGKALYRVTLNDGFSVLVTKNHLFNVRSGKSGFMTLSVEQMMNKDLVLNKKGEGRNKGKSYTFNSYYKRPNNIALKYSLPIVEPIQYENNDKLDIDPYLLGVILGDGHITKNGRVLIEIGACDFEEIFLGQVVNETTTVNVNTRANSILGHKESLLSMGLCGKLSNSKFIPALYKYSSVDNRIAMLNGLMDTDGYCPNNKNFQGSFYTTVSKQLADDVAELVQGLGGVVRISSKIPTYTHLGEKKKGQRAYSLNIKFSNSINPFRLERKRVNYKQPKKYVCNRKIKNIEFEKFGDSVCISVEAKNSLYVTEGAIVTHNTFESIIYAETTNSFPCIVVVPASVKYNWQEKWREITGNKRSVAVIESKETKKRVNDWEADVIVINYDIVGKKQGQGATVRFPQLLEIPFKMAVFDEAHFLKNKTSQRAKASKMIVKNIETVQLLTGTATMSKPAELWNLLKLINKSDAIASDWYQFIRRYCGGYRGKFGWVTDGATNTLELNEKLRESCYIRREKRDVLKELPNVTKQVLKTPITNIRDINKATDNFIEYVKETMGEDAAEKAMEAEHLVALGVLRRLAIEGKTKAIEQYLKDWKESGVKLLVFGLHKEPLEYLSNKFKGKLIAGGMSSKDKQETVKGWINNDDIFLFANMQSAGTGVDGLQHVCSNMLIIELPWRPSDLTQVIGRLDRSGQKSATTVTYMLSYDTIDREMWAMLADKELVTEAVNKGVDIKRNGSGIKAVVKKMLKLRNG